MLERSKPPQQRLQPAPTLSDDGDDSPHVRFDISEQKNRQDEFQQIMQNWLKRHILLSQRRQNEDSSLPSRVTRFVAIGIPEIPPPNVKAFVLWIQAPQSPYLANTSESITEYVEMPQDIKWCQKCIVTCTDTSDEWNPSKLIHALFLRMFLSALMDPKTDQNSKEWDDSDVRMFNVHSCGEASDMVDEGKTGNGREPWSNPHNTVFPDTKLDASAIALWRVQKRDRQGRQQPDAICEPHIISSNPTRYIISFPSVWENSENYTPTPTCPIDIEVIRPNRSPITHLIFVECGMHILQGCIAEIEHESLSLDLAFLVRDVINTSSTSVAADIKLPYSLPSGGNVTQIRSPSIVPAVSTLDILDMDFFPLANRYPQELSLEILKSSFSGFEPSRFISHRGWSLVSSLGSIPQVKTLYHFVFPSTMSGSKTSKFEEMCQVIVTIKRQHRTPEIVKFPAPPTEWILGYRRMCTLVLEDNNPHLDEFSLAAGLLHNGIGTDAFHPPNIRLPWILQDGSIVRSYECSATDAEDASSIHPFEVPSPAPYSFSFGQSPISNLASPASFMTASPASFMTARSTYNSPAFVLSTTYSPMLHIETIKENEAKEFQVPAAYQRLSQDYLQILQGENIIQPLDSELNWSGKGQHVAFLPQDEIPLISIAPLGTSLTARVDKVLCKRIALARKTMKCSRQWTVADALREVYHLQNLQHFHIVQLVGSYVQKRTFSMLMYPAADCHLGTFLEDTCDIVQDHSWTFRARFLASSLCCLTTALAFVHDNTTKHMDIKPQNILIRNIQSSNLDWRIYLADFGLSRSFASQGHSQTDGPTSRTPRYCAPEVYNYEFRGRASDIFSLGCVFLEILTVFSRNDLQDFADFRRGDGDDESFHANLTRVHDWAQERLVNIMVPSLDSEHQMSLEKNVFRMVSKDPNHRPTAAALVPQFHMLDRTHDFAPRGCCESPPEPYVAWEDPQKKAALSLRSGPTETSVEEV